MKTKKKTGVRKGIRRKKQPPRNYSRLLLTIGIVLLCIWGLHKVLYFRSLKLSESLVNAYAAPLSSVIRPNRIVIGSLINLPIVEAGYVNGTWLISPNRANHVAQSASPGSNGNIIIYAHNKVDMFAPLITLKGGETVLLMTTDGKTHQYKVASVTEVSPDDTRLLQPTLTETLTLYTCSGFLDSKRFVVRALPTLENK